MSVGVISLKQRLMWVLFKNQFYYHVDHVDGMFIWWKLENEIEGVNFIRHLEIIRKKKSK
jgi:hypothetical protein